jgi:hypothetical protein
MGSDALTTATHYRSSNYTPPCRIRREQASARRPIRAEQVPTSMRVIDDTAFLYYLTEF